MAADSRRAVRHMPEGPHANIQAVLEELCSAVAADGGGAFYVADADGVMHQAAAVGGRMSASSLLNRLRTGEAPNGKALVLSMPGSSGSVLILTRRSGTDFTQQDTTIARLYMRPLDESSVHVPSHARASGWSRQLEAIQRIAARLTRLASVEDVGAAICNETRQVISYDEAQVLVAAGPNASMRVVAAAGSIQADGTTVPLPSTGACGQALVRAATGGVPVIVSDLSDLGPGREGAYSLLCVPLHYETRVSGLICLAARGANQFDDDDLRLLQILSDQAAVAIENARLLAGRDQLVDELGALLDVSKATSAASDETDLARRLAGWMRKATGAEAAVVSRWDDDSTMLRELWREGVGGPQAAIDVADSPIRREVLRSGRPEVIRVDASGPTESVEALQLRVVGAKSLVVLPLNADGRTKGIVELISFAAPAALDEGQMQTIEAITSLAATGLEKVRLLDQLRSAADMDLVTQVHNHRYLQERLRQEVARSARSHSPFAVLMLDLDKFKPVNDRHGHADGDRVLHNIGATIKAHVRTSDVVSRYGGDEFVVLMPDTPPDHADRVARRVVAGILQRRPEMSDGTQGNVGGSAGLAVYPQDGRTSAQLLQAADAAMYAAKRTGGRQIERSTREPVLTLEAAPA